MVVPQWWLALAGRQVEATGLGLVEIGKRLAAKVDRDQDFNHGTISRFLAGEGVTDELVEAFAKLFDLPQPVYYPRDLNEAMMFRAATVARRDRLDDMDAAAEKLAGETGKRQTQDVDSANGAKGRGRDGSVGKGRPSTRRG